MIYTYDNEEEQKRTDQILAHAYRLSLENALPPG